MHITTGAARLDDGPRHEPGAARLACVQSQLRCQPQVWPLLTQTNAPLLPSLQITPSKGSAPQPSCSGQAVVERGGLQIVVQAQAASFSLPHCWLECTVPAGQSI